VEYSLLLSLVALAVIVVLVVLVPNIGNVYSTTSEAFDQNDGDEEDVEEELADVVALSIISYTDGWLHLHATTDGGYDPDVTMTASPGGVMSHPSNTHYTITFLLSGPCPCTVTVTSSAGGSSTVTVP
jgi:hypothetical protein